MILIQLSWELLFYIFHVWLYEKLQFRFQGSSKLFCWFNASILMQWFKLMLRHFHRSDVIVLYSITDLRCLNNLYNYKIFLQRSNSNMKIEHLRFSRRIQTASKCSKNTIWYSLSICDAHHLNSLDTFYHGNSKRREDVIPDNQKDNVSVWWVRKEKTLVKQNYMKEEEKTFTNQSHYPRWLFSLFNFVIYDD